MCILRGAKRLNWGLRCTNVICNQESIHRINSGKLGHVWPFAYMQQQQKWPDLSEFTIPACPVCMCMCVGLCCFSAFLTDVCIMWQDKEVVKEVVLLQALVVVDTHLYLYCFMWMLWTVIKVSPDWSWSLPCDYVRSTNVPFLCRQKGQNPFQLAKK